MFLLKLNPIEPPWYGPVCPVVWEGRHREMSPYPDGGGPPLRSRSLKEGPLPDLLNNLLGNDSFTLSCAPQAAATRS